MTVATVIASDNPEIAPGMRGEVVSIHHDANGPIACGTCPLCTDGLAVAFDDVRNHTTGKKSRVTIWLPKNAVTTAEEPDQPAKPFVDALQAVTTYNAPKK